MKGIYSLFLIGIIFLNSYAKQEKVEMLENLSNPIIPGWFADPTIKKFGDIYYIYSTTDNEMLASGAPTVWYSSDLKNWYNYIMEIPSLNTVELRNFWAPDIIEGDDGKIYACRGTWVHYNSSNHGAEAHLDAHFDLPFKQIPEANKWHHIVVTFDGVVEKVYVNGKLDNAQNMLLSTSIKKAKIRIGASDIGEHYSGFMASFGLYDYALAPKEIIKLLNSTKPINIARVKFLKN